MSTSPVQDESDKERGLSAQQQRFVEAYCTLWKGAPAARAAGYSEARAKQTANELLKDPRIRAAIKVRADELAMTTEEATKRMSDWGRASVEDVLSRQIIEYTPRIQKNLAQLVDEFRAEMDYEQEVALATEALLSGKVQTKYRKQQAALHQQRKIKLVRLEMELARNPKAKKWVNGETIAKEVAHLDLIKVLDAKAGGMIKKIVPNKFGTAVELHDAKDATDKMLKIHGAYAPQKIELGSLSDEQIDQLFKKALDNS